MNTIPNLEEGTPPTVFQEDNFSVFMGSFFGFFILIFAMIFLSLASMIYFIVHATKNPNFQNRQDNMLVVWILILVLVGYLGCFIYWLVEIKLRNPKPIIP